MTSLPNSKICHLHEGQFDGTKLRFARERLNISRTKLANLVGTSPSFVTACEKGRKRPSSDLESVLAAELRVTRHYFYGAVGGGWELGDCHLRHRQAVTKTEQSLIRSQLYFYSRVVGAIGRFVSLPAVNLPNVTPYDLRTIEQIAGEVRRLWKLGPASPIDQLCRLVENAGVVIVSHTGELAHIDAGSHLSNTPVILVRRRNCGATRMNSDIGHELGELIFHASANQTVEHERKMNRFVGALLMPETGFAQHFTARPLTLSHLWELKRTWRASVSAVLQRSLELQLLPEATFVSWKRRFAARGWSRIEPNEPSLVGPDLLRRSMDVIMRQGVSLSEFASHVGLSELGLGELLRENGLGSLMTTVVVSPQSSTCVDLEADEPRPELRLVE